MLVIISGGVICSDGGEVSTLHLQTSAFLRSAELSLLFSCWRVSGRDGTGFRVLGWCCRQSWCGKAYWAVLQSKGWSETDYIYNIHYYIQYSSAIFFKVVNTFYIQSLYYIHNTYLYYIQCILYIFLLWMKSLHCIIVLYITQYFLLYHIFNLYS